MERNSFPSVALLALSVLLTPLASAQRSMVVDELPPASWSEETIVETEHYELHVVGPKEDAEELGRVLEAAREQFRAVFRAAPKTRKGQRVVVHLVPDRAAWLACMRGAGIEPPSNADFAHYSPDEDTVFVYRQRSPWLTRSVLIHGACQQFHCKCKPKNRDLARTWIPMSLGDHFATHTWDGEELVLGARTLIDPADMAGRALQRIDPDRFDPAKLYEEGLAHAEVGFAIVRYTLQGKDRARRKGFEKLALGYSGSKLHANTYASKLGDPVELTHDLLAWLEEHQSPLRELTGAWEDLGHGRIVGGYEVDNGEALAELKRPFESLRVRIPRGELGATVGAVTLFYEDGWRWNRVFVTRDGVFVRETRKGAVTRESQIPVPGQGPVELELRRSGESVLVSAGGDELLLDEVPSERSGLYVREGPLEITLIDWR